MKGLAACAALALMTAACGAAPETPLGMKEVPRDVVYGDRTRPTAPAQPAAADPAPAFPGFLVPPVVETPPVVTPPVPVACPEDDPLATPEEATANIAGQPLPGGYSFRQTATQTVDGTKTVLPVTSVHRVDNVVGAGPGVVAFDVAIAEADVVTTTTFQIRRGGLDNGLFISQIRTDDSGGTASFTPSAAVKMLPTPAVRGTRWNSVGTDPLGGVSMIVNGYVSGKTRVNACGTPVDAWLVEVGADPQTGQPSRIITATGSLVITGTYAVATQLGGLIVAQDLKLEGDDRGSAVTIERSDRLNKVRPDA